ncbi:bifunctional folylpolyglutamate synthase/dihydrofolate synthase [Paratractidigestivibacter sp.]|uniref:bifunctional folylpolyglutamate synthase/dihydrofolate synthase n=1 Tax=Paratractidigestivibacter sp. TaxID=2847316 RepID=UPI002ABE5241|nr:Mur ligase family protein [Paratractidigestivibacter sp.]
MYQVPFEFEALDYEGSLAELHSALRFGICPMLETVEDMLAELADPDLAFDCVQIAGTNGKTSTSRYTAAILAGEGKRCALYTSPELVSYTERMEVAGTPVSEADFAYGISAAAEAGRRVNARRAAAGERPYDITEFDTLTVAAMVVFARAGVDVCVLECGMGGRWDATSAAKSIRSVAVTGIGLDHIRVLGDTLEAIAGEKAAIIKPGRTCVLGSGCAEAPSVEAVFLEQCASAGVTPTLVLETPADDAQTPADDAQAPADAALPRAAFRVTKRPSRLGAPLELDVTTSRADYHELAALKPSYQAANIACAVALCEDHLGRALDAEKLYQSVIACPTPGRFQLLRPEPPLLIDACHNPQSVQAFLASLSEITFVDGSEPLLLCAVLADKDVKGIVEQLSPRFPKVACTQTSSPRALAVRELAELFRDAGSEIVGEYADVPSALSALCEESLIVCGSITLAGEVAAEFA